MDTNKTSTQNQLAEVAARIKEMREILGMTVEETAKKTEVTLDDYKMKRELQIFPSRSFISARSLSVSISRIFSKETARS